MRKKKNSLYLINHSFLLHKKTSLVFNYCSSSTSRVPNMLSILKVDSSLTLMDSQKRASKQLALEAFLWMIWGRSRMCLLC